MRRGFRRRRCFRRRRRVRRFGVRTYRNRLGRRM